MPLAQVRVNCAQLQPVFIDSYWRLVTLLWPSCTLQDLAQMPSYITMVILK